MEENAKNDIDGINFLPRDTDQDQMVSQQNQMLPQQEQMDVLFKYCLFWMIHFPNLLLYTWNHLKDIIPQH